MTTILHCHTHTHTHTHTHAHTHAHTHSHTHTHTHAHTHAHTQSHTHTHLYSICVENVAINLHSIDQKKLGMISGVTIPCTLSLFNAFLFLRLGLVLGQVGIEVYTIKNGDWQVYDLHTFTGGVSCFHGNAPDCPCDHSHNSIRHLCHSNQRQCGEGRGLLYPKIHILEVRMCVVQLQSVGAAMLFPLTAPGPRPHQSITGP